MPEESSTKKVDMFNILGSTGLKQMGGMVYEELLTRLQGIRGVRFYTEMMDNAAPIGAVRYIIQALVRQVEATFEPSLPEEQEAIDQAVFVQECSEDMILSFDEFVSQTLTYMWYGFAYFEKTYKLRKGKSNDVRLNSVYDDGKIGWREIAIRAQETLDVWEFDENNNILGMHQFDSWSGKKAFIPIDKAILFRTESVKNNPEGRSIFRTSVFDWYFYKKISEIEGIGVERDLAGLITMEVPLELLNSSASADVQNKRIQIETMLSQLKRDEREYAIVPSELDGEGKPTGYKLKLLSAGGTRQLDTTKIKDGYKLNMLQSVVAQFIQLGMQGVGSFALASSQTDLFAVALSNFLDIISSTFNKQAIGPLMEANGVDRELWPVLKFGDIEAQALDVLGQYLMVLANAGILPMDDEGINNKLLSLADLPIPKNSDETQKGCGCGDVQKTKKVKLRGSAIGQLKKYYKSDVK